MSRTGGSAGGLVSAPVATAACGAGAPYGPGRPDGKQYSKSFSARAAAAQHAAAMADDAIFQRLLADTGRGGAR